MGQKMFILLSCLKIRLKRANNFFFSLLLLLLLIIPEGAAEVVATIPAPQNAREQADWGAYYWQKGELHRAIDAWQKEAEIYRLQGLTKKEAEALLKISQSYISLGQLRLAIFYLEKLIASVEESSLTARAWEQLGNAYTRNGELAEAEIAYNKSLEIEPNLSTLNNLVILLQKQILRAKLQADSARPGAETERYRAESESYQTEAIHYAKQALALSQTEQSSSSLRTLIEWGKLSSTGLSTQELERGRRLLEKLPSLRIKVFLAINWAKLDSAQSQYWFSQAQEIAEQLGDEFAESYALLELGLLAEKSGNLSQALDYAQAAQLKAQLKWAYGSLYQSHWLASRIHQQMEDEEAAISNRSDAIAALDAFNQGSQNISVERRLNFKTRVEPIYRGMLKLLLDAPAPSQTNLKEALFVFDRLRLAQLQQYFGDNCFEIEGKSLPIEDVLTAKNAVLINSIILDDRTHFVLQLPDGTLRHSQAKVGEAEITKIATEWYKTLSKGLDWQLAPQGQALYDMIIRPFEQELAQINPDTIIFIHDGLLRNLPMASLFDGKNEEFLAQKWASVSSIGLNFKSTTSSQKKLEALAFGLGVAREGWSELDEVEPEIEKVIDTLGGQKFLNQEFTTDNLVNELNRKKYSVVHLATHGYFGGIAENSFILAYDQPLSALDLEDFLSQSLVRIELLVLSACETAISSDRSALGLAGVALRSGVDSVLGSFWQVQDDEQLELIKAFYSNFPESNFDKIKALQQIQIEQIKNRTHPSKWAALNLIGNF